MSLFWTAQLVGLCAIIFTFWIYQVNKRSSILILNIFSSVFSALQFILLHAYTGAAMNTVAGARSYVIYKSKPDQGNVWVLLIFIVIAALATAVTWQGGISLLPLCGNWLNAIATWQTNTTRLRRYAALAVLPWIIYSVIVRSYPSLLIEAFTLCSILIGQYRFDFKKTNPAQGSL